jgi:hypothetical protein
MATAYWTGNHSATLGINSGNWITTGSTSPYTPQNGDDLIFDSATATYHTPAVAYDGTLDTLTFGTVTASDGSNCFDGAMQCGALYLAGGSSAGQMGDPGGTCTTVNAGADGSNCEFCGTAIDAGNVFAGSSVANPAATLSDITCNDSAICRALVAGIATFNDTSEGFNFSATTANFNDESSTNGISAETVNWKTSGSMIDGAGLTIEQLNVFTNLAPDLGDLNDDEIDNVVLMTSGAQYADPWSATDFTINGNNLSAGNIKNGVQILGVTGTAAAAAYLSGGSSAF